MKYPGFLKAISVAGLSAALLIACSEPEDEGAAADGSNENNAESEEQAANVSKKEDKPENVIVMIGDGLAAGQIEIARLLEYGKEGILHMEEMEHSALMRTYSDDNWVTDSAAAGTALATGHKTENGMIGVTPDGEEVDSILQVFQDYGKKTGLISNNTITDATPAAYAASVPDRSGQEEIARQMYENNIDVLLGGGKDYFQPENHDGEDLIASFEEDGYDVVTDRDELFEAEGADKLLGLFHPSFMNYKVDYDLYDSNEPSLNEMSEAALDVLSADDDGFFLMIEGARIDHAAHAADFTSIWQETIEFDNTVADVLEWAEERDDTLVVVLSDHETMGVAASEVMDKEGLRNVSASPEYMVSQFEFDEEEGEYTTDSVQAVLNEYANIDVSEEEVAAFNEYIYDEEGELVAPHVQGWEIGTILADHFGAGIMNREIREESGTGGHSGNMVPVFAEGVGAEKFNGTFDNTDVPHIIAEIAGMEFDGKK